MKKRKKTENNEMVLLITGSFRFPDNDAAAQRVLGIAKAIRMQGGKVLFCGWEQKPREQDRHGNNYVYQDFQYYSQKELDLNNNDILSKVFSYLKCGNNTLKWIKNYITDKAITHIISYGGGSLFLVKLFTLCKRHDIKLICDCTEWYQGSHLPGGTLGIVNLDNNIRVRVIYPFIKNIIVISTFLQLYLNKKKCNTIVVPPLIDSEEKKWNFDAHDMRTSSSYKRKVIYAGDPGQKDLLSPIFIALEKINYGKDQIEFNVIGIDKHILKNIYFVDYEDLPNYINCVGRIPHDEVPKHYMKCDFSIFFRKNQRYANAGFPTKLVESLTAGVPVITNKTSDIPKYIIDGQNGFLLHDLSEESIRKIFENVLSLSVESIQVMHQKAKISSLNNFDFRQYSDKICNYLEAI